MQRWPHPHCRKSQPQTYRKHQEPLTETTTWEHKSMKMFATDAPAAAPGSAHEQQEVASPVQA